MLKWLTASIAPFATVAFLGLATVASAQSTADPEKPVTPPDSYRVVMENDRVRIIEVHIKAHSKVNVDSPAGRDRFLYMLSDGALILNPPGKTPYEFALHAGETAVFPAVSPVVENDTDAPVRALMVEVKEGGRAIASGKLKGKFASKRGARGKVAARSSGKSKSVAVRSKAKPKQAAKPRKPTVTAAVKGSSAKPPLNLQKAATKPAKRLTGKGRDSNS